jgi:acyl-ACP thioesterase
VTTRSSPDHPSTLVPHDNRALSYSRTRRVRHGDAGPDGGLRLDALARYLQDLAFDANHDAGVIGVNWIIRRVVVDCEEPPSCTDVVELTTWVSGIGSRWAERRTTLHSAAGAHIEAAVLWVHVDPQTGMPARLPAAFLAAFGTPGGTRRISSRLLHGAPRPDAERRPWIIRWTDLDPVGHMNNAAYWEPVQEELARRGRSLTQHTAELELRRPISEASPVTLLTTPELDTWITGPQEHVFASARVRRRWPTQKRTTSPRFDGRAGMPTHSNARESDPPQGAASG